MENSTVHGVVAKRLLDNMADEESVFLQVSVFLLLALVKDQIRNERPHSFWVRIVFKNKQQQGPYQRVEHKQKMPIDALWDRFRSLDR